MTYKYKKIDSPVGQLILVAHDTNLVSIFWEREDFPKEKFIGLQIGDSSILNNAEQQLSEYFDRSRQNFDLSLEFNCGTEFQRKVWDILRLIPYGQTISYAELARKIGSPDAIRAVGTANSKNPIPIVVPCHRVVGSNGKLTGFSGGIQNKAFLLNLESNSPRLFDI